MEACWKQSWTIAWEALLYFMLLDGVALLGLNHLFIVHKDSIEWLLSWLTGVAAPVCNYWVKLMSAKPTHQPSIAGSWQELQDGTRIPTSLANLADPKQELPYRPSELGSAATDVHSLQGQHFLAACCKLAYEHAPVMQDTIARCGLFRVCDLAYKDVMTGTACVEAEIRVREQTPEYP